MDKEGSWIPVTPMKPVGAKQSIQIVQGNWEELNNLSAKSIGGFDLWESEMGFTDLLELANVATTSDPVNGAILPNINTDCASASNLYEDFIPSRLSFDLNSIPVSNLEVSTNISSQFVPFTPDQSNKQANKIQNLNYEVADKMIEVIEIDDDDDDSDYSQGKDQAHIQLQENHNPDEGTDLSKTPQQQKPRRRKHRPKVVREGGKPGRPQKASTPKTVSPKEVGPSGKRKYVRKKAIEKPQANTPTEQINAGPAEHKKPEGSIRSCRRPLHFDNNNIYNEVRDESSSYRPHSTFGTDSHDQNFSNRVQSEIDAIRGKNRIIFTDATHGKGTMMNTNNSTSSNIVGLYYGEQGRGQKRVNSSTTHEAVNASGSRYNSLQAFGEKISENTCGFVGMQFPAICKKKRTEKVQNGMVTSGASKMTYIQNQINATSGPAASGVEDNQRSLQCMLAFSQADNMLKKKRSKGPTRVRDYASLIGTIPMVSRPIQPHTCMEALAAGPHARLARKKRTKRNPHVNRLPLAIYNRYQRIKKPRGRPYGTKRRAVYSVESLIEQFSLLNLSAEQYQTALVPYNMKQKKRYRHHKDQNALVLYQRNGEVVPFNGPLKIRKPRPKVDLDDETSRVWKLLLQDINSVGVDGNDEDKAKWWEEERSIFRGRAESFIARMHLVQGDRRFSKWKGSVVDSCVGVFLTQNVSDHLSSSAFMALAARYPVKSKTSNSQSDEEETTELGKQPEEKTIELGKQPEFLVTEPEDTIEWPTNNSDQPACQQSSITIQDAEYNVEKEEIKSDESFGSTSDRASSEKLVNISARKESIKIGDSREQDDVFSSQNSVDSSQNSADSPSIAQNVSCSQSSSDTEPVSDKSNESSSPTSFLELLRMAHRVFNDKSDSEPSNQKLPLESPQKQNMGPATDYHLHLKSDLTEVQSFDNAFREESRFSGNPTRNEEMCGASEQSGVSNITNETSQSQTIVRDPKVSAPNHIESPESQTGPHTLSFSVETSAITERTSVVDNSKCDTLTVESNLNTPKSKGGKAGKEKQKEDWDILRKVAQETHGVRKRDPNTMDSVDWETIRNADVNEIAYTIRERGMNNMLAERIKDFLNRLVREHGSVNLEWLRDVPPDKAKEYLLSFRGLGLKSVECVRLLTLHHLAFPVDTNVGRIAVRLGWVPLQPLPESLQLHLLELYPILESIQKFLWPRLCKLDQPTLYELHYQMITFGKVFCTKSKPNCNACPMRGECRHFASAFASARLALPAPEEKSIVPATENIGACNTAEARPINTLRLPAPQADQQLVQPAKNNNRGPIIEEPASPEPIIEVPQSPEPEQREITELDIEDGFEDPDEIPTIKLNIEQFSQNLQNYMQHNMELQEGDMSKALVALTQEAASLPTPKLKNISRLRTEHQVYELPDSHPLLEGLEKREPDDPSSYLLAIWTPGETPDSIQPPEGGCNPHETGILCGEKTCFSCNNIREFNSQTVRGTLLIPCRTAMRGSFPLNGTYFQVNEMFADHDSSLKPIDVPRSWIWNLPRRTVYFGTSIPTIFKGLTTEGIQYCFWRGFVCVRGFDQKTRAPRPLMARLHFPASKMVKTKGKPGEE